MKHCTSCRTDKPIKNFSINPSRKDGLNTICRECKADYNKIWYKRNQEPHIQQVKANTKRYRERNRTFVKGLKQNQCTDCGQRFDPESMDFDHLPQFIKIDTISHLVTSGCSIETLQAELAKCELVCAICHRKRTGLRRGTESPIMDEARRS